MKLAMLAPLVINVSLVISVYILFELKSVLGPLGGLFFFFNLPFRRS